MYYWRICVLKMKMKFCGSYNSRNDDIHRYSIGYVKPAVNNNIRDVWQGESLFSDADNIIANVMKTPLNYVLSSCR